MKRSLGDGADGGRSCLFLSPFEVRFSQKTCSEAFRDGKRVVDLVGGLLAREQQKRDVPLIRVAKHGDRWYSLDNRRLAAFRLVAMHRPELCKIVKCQAVVPDEREWRKKFSTKCEGRFIILSRTNGEVVGDSLATTTYRASAITDSSGDADAEWSDSDGEEVEDLLAQHPLVSTVAWKCRVNKEWKAYPDAVSNGLEQEYQDALSSPESVGISNTFALPNVGRYRVHFTANRQFADGDFSRRRAVLRDFQPPPLSALVTPARAELGLQLPEDAFRRTRAVIDKVVRTLHELRPSKVYEGGSFKKRTCLAYDFDVDLVLHLNNFDHQRMTEYKDSVRRALAAAFPKTGPLLLPQVWSIGETPFCLKIAVRMVAMDIVITGSPGHADPGNPPRFFEGAKSPERDDFILSKKDEYHRLHHLILLAKCWKKRQHWSKAGGPISYLIELLCVRAVQEAGKDCSLLAALRRFLQNCAEGVLAATDTLGKRLEVPEDDRDVFARQAQAALASLAP